MSTPFSDLYNPMRTLLGDIGEFPAWSDAQLDLGISAALLSEDGYDEATGTIVPDLATKTDKLRISLKSAIALMSPSSGKMSYRTPVLSVSREDGRSGHLGYLEELLRELDNGSFAIDSEDEWDKFFDGPRLVSARLSKLSFDGTP